MAKTAFSKPILGAKPVDIGTGILKNNAFLQSTGKSGGGGSSGSSDGGGSAAPAIDYKGQVQSLTQELYETTFQPDPVAYTAATEEELKTRIAAWLRPAYDAAILNRAEKTKVYGAELDADAISRGMGASTYVTDVKSRQQKEEARDIALLETDYGAVLAKNVSERLAAGEENALDVAMFNAEQQQEAYALAYDAAMSIVALMGGGGGASSGSSRRKSGGGGGGGSSASTVKATSAANCATFLSGLSKAERAQVYAGATPQNEAYRSEIIASVGVNGFYDLQKKYSSLP